MKITFETMPHALEKLFDEIKSLRQEITEKSTETEPEMVDRRAAREILGTFGRPLSEARFAQLKNEGKITTYGFGTKHWYSVEELEQLKRK